MTEQYGYKVILSVLADTSGDISVITHLNSVKYEGIVYLELFGYSIGWKQNVCLYIINLVIVPKQFK